MDTQMIDVDKLKAGVELDALIGRYIFPLTNGYTRAFDEPYSTDIGAAWQVWEKLPNEKRLHEGDVEDTERRFTMFCGGYSWGASSDYAHADGVEVSAPTAPLAICKAALKYVLTHPLT